MRGRSLLFPALVALVLIPAAEAGLVPDVSESADPCVDVSPMFEEPPKPLEVVTFTPHCTAKVTFHHTSQEGTFLSIETDQVEIIVTGARQNGTFVYTILVYHVESGKEFVLECSTEPDRIMPTYPVRQWDMGCWGWLMDRSWMN